MKSHGLPNRDTAGNWTTADRHNSPQTLGSYTIIPQLRGVMVSK